MQTADRKIGQNRGRSRLWIEGKLLTEAGFAHGDRWDLVANSIGLIIQRIPSGKRKISGKPGRPVIDILAASLGACEDAQRVKLTYAPGTGHIIVTPIKED